MEAFLLADIVTANSSADAVVSDKVVTVADEESFCLEHSASEKELLVGRSSL